MAQEVGTAYVTLLPSSKGFGKAVEGQLDSAATGHEAKQQSLWAKVAKWGGIAAAAIGTVFTAKILKGGIARALDLEDARAKLKGLGHDAEAVEGIMANALASVKGTAFGLDAAATVAATAVAAGIKPGQELERYLRLTADAATIAGTSMDEMGSILNKVTAKGRAGMENMNQLMERGIPIMQWLQDEYGVTADELEKMVARGEVDAATFQKVIEDNIGGAALTAGDVTRGAWANMWTSLSNLSAAFVEPALEPARNLFQQIQSSVEGVLERLNPLIGRWEDWMGSLSESIMGGGHFGGGGFAESILEWLDKVTAYFQSGDGAPLVQAAKDLFGVLQEVGGELRGELATAFSEVLNTVMELAPELAADLVPALGDLIVAVTDLAIALIPLIPPLVDLAAAVLPPITAAISDLAAMISSPEGQAVIEFIATMIESLATPTGDILAGFSEWLETLGPLSAPLQAVVDTLAMLFSSSEHGGQVVATAFELMTTTISDSLTAIWAGITGFVANVSNGFGSLAGDVGSTVSGMWATIGGAFSTGVTTAVNFVTGLPGRALSALGDVGSTLLSSGQSLIQGFIDGITSMLDRVGGAVGGVMDFVAGFFPSSPAKRGPFSAAGWRRIGEGGAALAEQFAAGFGSASQEWPMAGLSAASAAAGIYGTQLVGVGASSMPSSVALRVGESEFTGYVESVSGSQADQRSAATRRGWRVV